MKLETLVNNHQGLQYLARQKLKSSLSFRIATFLRKAEPHLEAFNKAEMELIKNSGTPDESGQNIRLTDPKAYTKERNELLSLELEDLIPPAIAYDDLLTLTEIVPSQLSVLCDWLVKAPEVENIVEIEATRKEVYDAYSQVLAIGEHATSPELAKPVVHMLQAMRSAIQASSKLETELWLSTKEGEDNTELVEFANGKITISVSPLKLSDLDDLNLQAAVFVPLEKFVQE